MSPSKASLLLCALAPLANPRLRARNRPALKSVIFIVSSISGYTNNWMQDALEFHSSAGLRQAREKRENAFESPPGINCQAATRRGLRAATPPLRRRSG